MEVVKVQKTPAHSLLPALRTAETTAITKAVMSVNVAQVESLREQRLELEKEYYLLRTQWKKASPEERPAIAEKGTALAATISAMPEFPSLRALAARSDAQNVTDEVAMLVSWLNDQLNIKEKMSIDQVELTAICIMQEYGHFGLEDIAACLRNALRGAYGQIYARLDVAVMLDWLNRFDTELTRDRIYRAEARHANLKESPHADRGVGPDGETKEKTRQALEEYMRTKKY